MVGCALSFVGNHSLNLTMLFKHTMHNQSNLIDVDTLIKIMFKVSTVELL